ncbi:hypothetical protein AAJ76_6600016717 [Vairimorpha ceranae]|uniref:Uncharacterized protein n=1 Tax=Vairimorpha ceranae TaxID=40302 RepID=A0A0F9Z9I5_9MICR|nr:hypothetical protein AAJ76_6600016717 [Vairimorpha ceranae]KKO74489.1 hypothetical protein AAJ76_6600016717 [Vairimorpha ceranae]
MCFLLLIFFILFHKFSNKSLSSIFFADKILIFNLKKVCFFLVKSFVYSNDVKSF